MDIETEFTGWKMCLYVTEFLVIDHLGRFIAEFEQTHAGVSGLVTTGFIIQCKSELTRAAHRCQHFGTAAPPARDSSINQLDASLSVGLLWKDTLVRSLSRSGVRRG
jgi:hypothetical protein